MTDSFYLDTLFCQILCKKVIFPAIFLKQDGARPKLSFNNIFYMYIYYFTGSDEDLVR